MATIAPEPNAPSDTGPPGAEGLAPSVKFRLRIWTWNSSARISEPLGKRDIDVWTICLADAANQRQMLEALLSPAERERLRRFRQEDDRNRFTAGRGILRVLAAQYRRRGTDEIEVCLEPGGKPTLSLDPDENPLHFNISHSAEIVAIAFARTPVGIDAEKIRSDVDWREIAGHFFSASELQQILDLPSAHQRLEFFRRWTRKEALAKAAGTGLQVPLAELRSASANGEPETIHDCKDSLYTVCDFEPASGYAGAVACAARTHLA